MEKPNGLVRFIPHGQGLLPLKLGLASGVLHGEGGGGMRKTSKSKAVCVEICTHF